MADRRKRNDGSGAAPAPAATPSLFGPVGASVAAAPTAQAPQLFPAPTPAAYAPAPQPVNIMGPSIYAPAPAYAPSSQAQKPAPPVEVPKSRPQVVERPKYLPKAATENSMPSVSQFIPVRGVNS